MNPLVIAASAVIVAIIAGFVVQRLNRSAKMRIAERQRALRSWHASTESGGAAPLGDADDDDPELLDRDAPNLLERDLIVRVLDGFGDRDHRVDEQGRQDVEVLTAPRGESRKPRQVDRQLRGDQADLGTDGVAQYGQ